MRLYGASHIDAWTGVSHRDWYLDYGGPGVS